VRKAEPAAEIIARLRDEYAGAIAAEKRDPWSQKYST
jgi:hypothetical protein